MEEEIDYYRNHQISAFELKKRNSEYFISISVHPQKRDDITLHYNISPQNLSCLIQGLSSFDDKSTIHRFNLTVLQELHELATINSYITGIETVNKKLADNYAYYKYKKNQIEKLKFWYSNMIVYSDSE